MVGGGTTVGGSSVGGTLVFVGGTSVGGIAVGGTSVSLGASVEVGRKVLVSVGSSVEVDVALGIAVPGCVVPGTEVPFPFPEPLSSGPVKGSSPPDPKLRFDLVFVGVADASGGAAAGGIIL